MATDQNSVERVDDEVVRSFARAAVLAALMGAAVVVGSIPIPFSPIPVSLGVLIIYLMGLYLGPVWGPVSAGLYLTAGAIGLPLFANGGSGIGVLVGDSAGYLWSYPIAAALIGLIVHRGTALRDLRTVRLPILVGALLAGTIVIYAMGTAYMAWLLEMEAWEAIAAGALPFIPGELLKIAAAVAIVRAGRITPVRS